MTANANRYAPPKPPKPRKQKGPVSVFLSGEIRDLEHDIMLHPITQSTRPRRSPAMSRLSNLRAPKKRSRRRKPKSPATLTKPEVVPPMEPESPPMEPEVVLSLTEPGVIPSPTEPEDSAPQPEVIDLTADDSDFLADYDSD